MADRKQEEVHAALAIRTFNRQTRQSDPKPLIPIIQKQHCSHHTTCLPTCIRDPSDDNCLLKVKQAAHKIVKHDEDTDPLEI